MGRFSYGKPLVRVYEGDTAEVTIGAFCAIADDVVFVPGGNHRVDWVSIFPLRATFAMDGAFEDGHPATQGDIVVGNDVWIGRGATILSGVRIGDGGVIGAGAVVARDVRPYAVVVGNPGREVRRRFSDSQVEELLQIAWWDWEEDVIRARVADLNGLDVNGFIRRYASAPATTARTVGIST